jgi:hypothetical protein
MIKNYHAKPKQKGYTAVVGNKKNNNVNNIVPNSN